MDSTALRPSSCLLCTSKGLGRMGGNHTGTSDSRPSVVTTTIQSTRWVCCQTHIKAILRSPQLQIQEGVCPLRPEQAPDRAVLEGHRVTWRRETRPRPPSTEPLAGARGTGRRAHQRRSDLKGMRAFPREAEQEALRCKHSHQRFLECWPLGQTLSPHAPGVLCKG